MYKTKIEKGKVDPRTIWKIFKEFGASRKTGAKDTILGLKENDRLIFDGNEIVNIFNKYFVNVASQLKEPVEHSDFKHLTEYVDSSRYQVIPFFRIPEIASSFVRNFLVKLDVTKATGLDCIGLKLMKIAPMFCLLV